jgi:tetratricopeptide (TPR) repeat protein
VATAEPFGPVFKSGSSPVYGVAFSPDGRKVLTGSWDDSARLWDASTGDLIRTFEHREPRVRAVAFSPDGRTILTGGGDGVARMWEAGTGKPVGEPLRHQQEVRAVAFSPDGRMILTGSGDRTAQLWEVATGKRIGGPLQHSSFVVTVAFSPDGRLALTGCDDQTARLWSVPTGIPVGPPLQHRGKVKAVAVSPDGRTFLTGGEDSQAQFWEVPVPVEGEVEHVRLWANVLTTMRLEESGTIRVLGTESWEGCRRRLQELSGLLQAPKPEARATRARLVARQVLAWHQQRAQECEQSGHWFAADFHLSRLIDAAPTLPWYRGRRTRARFELRQWEKALADYTEAIKRKEDDAWLWAERGLFYGRLGQWKKAAADHTQAVGLRPDDLELWCQHAGVLLLAGDTDGYRQACAHVLGRFGRTKEPRKAYLVARSCALAPAAVPDPQRPVRLAAGAVSADRKAGRYLHTLGLAHYRAGEFDAAVRRLQESEKVDPRWDGRVVNWLGLALAHHHLGHAEEARRWLDKAVTWIDKHTRPAPEGGAVPLPLHPHNWLPCLILRGEAEALLGGPSRQGRWRGSSLPAPRAGFGPPVLWPCGHVGTFSPGMSLGAGAEGVCGSARLPREPWPTGKLAT